MGAAKEAIAAKQALDNAEEDQKEELRKAFKKKREAVHDALKAAMKLARQDGAAPHKALQKLRRQLMKKMHHKGHGKGHHGGAKDQDKGTVDVVAKFQIPSEQVLGSSSSSYLGLVGVPLCVTALAAALLMRSSANSGRSIADSGDVEE